MTTPSNHRIEAFKDVLEALFGTSIIVACALIATGLLTASVLEWGFGVVVWLIVFAVVVGLYCMIYRVVKSHGRYFIR